MDEAVVCENAKGIGMFGGLLGALWAAGIALQADNTELKCNSISRESGVLAVTKGSGCKRFNNLTVCNTLTTCALKVLGNATFGGSIVVNGGETINGPFTVNTLNVTGNATVDGSITSGPIGVTGDLVVSGDGTFGGTVTAAGFNTPSGPFFSGLRNYAVMTNQQRVVNALGMPDFEAIPWTPGAFNTPGITVSGNVVRLPYPGIFFVLYMVRFFATPDTATINNSTATAVLSQENVGNLQAIQDEHVNFTGLTGANVEMHLLLAGAAFVNTTNALDSNIQVTVTIPNASGSALAVPATSGTDANAQLIILQLN